jgi:hypothetical protein
MHSARTDKDCERAFLVYREFLENVLPTFQANNPHIEVEAKVKRNSHPAVEGFFGRFAAACCHICTPSDEAMQVVVVLHYTSMPPGLEPRPAGLR